MKIKLILTALNLLAFVTLSYACDCDDEEPSLEESLAKSATVFLGKVISIKDYQPIVKPTFDWQEYFIIAFQSIELFKGEKSDTLYLIAEASDCGGDFMIGNSYLVFSFINEQENRLEYHQCFRMALPEQHATEEIIRLKE